MMFTPFPFTAELSTNSLREFVVFWNDDVHTVSIHSGAFNQSPEGILRCLGIMISPSFQHNGPFKYPPCGVFHSVVNIPLESDPLELSFSTFIWGRRESRLGHTSIDFELRRATRRSVSRCRELGRRKRSRRIELGLGYPTQACCRTCISRSPMTRACSLMVGSRVVGSNVVVAMHNYRGCACNVGHGNGNAYSSWLHSHVHCKSWSWPSYWQCWPSLLHLQCWSCRQWSPFVEPKVVIVMLNHCPLYLQHISAHLCLVQAWLARGWLAPTL